MVTDAGTLAREPATVGRGQRIGHLVLSSLPQVLGAVLFAAMLWIFSGTLTNDPVLAELTESLLRLERLQEQRDDQHAHEVRALEVFVAARHRARTEDPATWSQRLVAHSHQP